MVCIYSLENSFVYVQITKKYAYVKRLHFKVMTINQMSAISNFQDGQHIKHISINMSVPRRYTIEILMSKHMIPASRNTTIPFRKVADFDHIGFSRLPAYSLISMNISTSRWHMIEIIVSKYVIRFEEYNWTIQKSSRCAHSQWISMNTTVTFRKAADGGDIGFSRLLPYEKPIAINISASRWLMIEILVSK